MSSKITGIYCITNKINNKKYIGLSEDICTRWKHHRHYLNKGIHDNEYLQRAWDKYGEENFEFKILTVCKPEELNELEIYYIDKFDTFNNRNNGYNLQSGGEYSEPSLETRKKISEKLTGEGHQFYGKHLDTNHKLKISCNMNNTGFFRVSKQKDDTCLKGFRYVYRYYRDGKRKELSSVDIIKLKDKVIKKDLEWFIVDENKAETTLNESNEKVEKRFTHHSDESKEKISATMNSTGYYRVTKVKSKTTKQGFLYAYQYYDNNKRKQIRAVNLDKLKEKVIAKGLTWKKL